MKHARKILALLLAVVMVMGLSITAFADDPDTQNQPGANSGSITIENAIPNQTYKVYRIFDLTYDSDNNSYAYTVNSDWKEFVKTSEALEFISVNDNYVTLKSGVSTENDSTKIIAFAKAALNFASSKGIKEITDGKASANGELSFSGLELGYYLVDSSAGILCSLDTFNGTDVTIREKNGQPTVEKKVQEDSTGDYGKVNDADIGQVVNFQTTITAQAGAQNYVLHDKMSDGLTFSDTDKNNVTVKLNNNETTVDASNYTVNSSGLSDGCTFEVVFNQDFCDTLNANDQIVVSYTATVNENAVIAGDGNPNKTWLNYGDNQHTEDSTTKTYVWGMDVIKYTKKGDQEAKLSGATFTLKRDEEGATEIQFQKVSGDADDTVAVYKVVLSEGVTSITTNKSGEFLILGLDAGKYILTETEAPKGYNKLAEPINIEISRTIGGQNSDTMSGNGSVDVTYDNKSINVLGTKVENQSGAELPSTGGMGTTLFYIFGGLMMLGAVVLLVTRKIMSVGRK